MTSDGTAGVARALDDRPQAGALDLMGKQAEAHLEAEAERLRMEALGRVGGVFNGFLALLREKAALEAEVKRHRDADELWERTVAQSLRRALEMLEADGFENIDHAAERVTARLREVEKERDEARADGKTIAGAAERFRTQGMADLARAEAAERELDRAILDRNNYDLARASA